MCAQCVAPAPYHHPSSCTLQSELIWLDRYLLLAGVPDGGYLFHARGNPFEVVNPSTWTERVKAIFARHGDVALCPKDARASFITFLRSGEHDEETVKAAAVAMRHSSKARLPRAVADRLSTHHYSLSVSEFLSKVGVGR